MTTRPRPRKAVGFLQNAWSPFYAGETWPREHWLRALKRSRSGRRLEALTRPIEGSVDVYFENSTRAVGDRPSSVEPADPEHIERVLTQQDPDYVLTFGKVAAAAVLPLLCGRPCVVLPHPAYRFLTDALYEAAANLLKEESFDAGVYEFVQGRREITLFRRF